MSNTTQLSAKERIESLLDDNSFVEIGAFVTKRNTDFNLQQKEVPADGVITGYGLIDGELVYVYSQDAKSLNGTIGEMHAKKITRIYDLALKVGAPIIGFIDSAGLRLQEATDALNAFGEMYLKQVLASGVIPQITAVFGTCGGGAALIPALTDFSFMTEKAKLFVNSPNVIDGNYTSKCDTGAASFQNEEVGLVDFVGENDDVVISQIKELIRLLPSNNGDEAKYAMCNDDLNRATQNFSVALTDAKRALEEISDDNFFMEMKAGYGKEMVTGFIRLNGNTVGAVANRTEILNLEWKADEKFDGALTSAGCEKAARFVSICDAFDIPILTLTNVTGFKATIEEEKTIAKAAAKLTAAFANASVPKVNLIVGKAYGSAYITMNSKHIGADMVFALDSAEIGMMDSELAAKIMYADADNKIISEKAAEYKELQSSPIAAAKRAYVDTIIEADAVRQHLAYAFEMLFSKRDIGPNKKHITI